jgi:hypothetical protein
VVSFFNPLTALVVSLVMLAWSAKRFGVTAARELRE